MDWQEDPLSLRHHVLVLALSDCVMFPGVRAFVELPRGKFLAARRVLQEGRAGGVGLIAKRPGGGELYQIGTFCRIVSAHATGQGSVLGGAAASVRLVLEGSFRFEVLRASRVARFHLATVRLLPEPGPEVEGIAVSGLSLRVQKHLLDLAAPSGQQQAQWPRSASRLADAVAAALRSPSLEQRQEVLEAVDVRERLERVLPLLQAEAERGRDSGGAGPGIAWSVIGGQQGVQGHQSPSPAAGLDALDDGPGSAELDEVRQLAVKVSNAGLAGDALKMAQRELKRLKAMQPEHPEYAVAHQYVETLASLPWQACTVDKHDLEGARASLDEDHFGLHTVKRRLLEFLAVQKLRGSTAGPVLCLEGPPGVGKTSLGESVARALGRRFRRIALGGLRDEAELRGHRRTYIGSSPGVVIQALQTLGVNNPVILLDEVDKLARGAHFNPEAVLLELLDPEQNSSFRDQFLGTPFDLSRVLFLCTANDASRLSRPLLDRLEVLKLSAYAPEEKAAITARHLLPRQRRLHALQRRPVPPVGLTLDPGPGSGAALSALCVPVWPAAEPEGALLELTPEAIDGLIAGWTAESGVRSLERRLAQICRWAALRLQRLDWEREQGGEADHALAPCGPDPHGRITVGLEHLPHILGQSRSETLRVQPLARGVAAGVSSAASGAGLFFVEAACMPSGDDELTVTGRPGQALRESVEVALSLVRGYLGRRGAPAGAPGGRALRVHVHFPGAAAAAEGPAAGLAVLLALASLLAGRPLRGGAAAAGELTLRGEVLAAGGVRGRALAARRAGARLLLLPRADRRAAEALPAGALGGLAVRYVGRAEEALDWALAAEGAGAAARL